MQIGEAVLARHFPDQHWRITTPTAGVQKEAYIAQSGSQKLFVKFDVEPCPLHRLSALGVAPALLYSGTHAGRSYVIQQFADGTHPDRSWFGKHVELLARTIKRYQDDPQLTVMLTDTVHLSPVEHVRHEVAGLKATLAAASSVIFKTDQTRSLFRLFASQTTRLHPSPLVPTHADPSPVNMLVIGSSLLMIDWDDVSLSDPLRDAGVMLWWYLSRSAWQSFFDAYGAPLDQDRVFWWSAKRSLQLALWLDARGHNDRAEAFLADFGRAVRHEDNPQVIAQTR
jgi:aminoglycoside phosphotransferase (APT) family kinase protein